MNKSSATNKMHWVASAATPYPINQSNFGLSTSFYAVLSKLMITDKIWKINNLYGIPNSAPNIGNP